MTLWHDIFTKYIRKYSTLLNKVTRPLKDHLGIPFFGYHRIDHNGFYSALTNHPEWAEHYLEKKYYLNDPYLKHPNDYSSGVSFFNSHEFNKNEKMIDSWKNKVHADQGLVLLEKNAESIEFYIFAFPQDISKVYLNHLNLLRTYSSYFKNQMTTLLLDQQKQKFALAFPKKNQNSINPKIESDQKKKFLVSIGHEVEWNQASLLTQREKDCLKLLSQGHSLKRIGSILSISPRTVEHYLENLKNKIHCWNKKISS